MSHASCDIECSGVFLQKTRETHPYHDTPNYMSYRGDYHLFIRKGDKVYMEVKNAGEIVISFAELQHNKYWKYYYDLSLILSNDEHKVVKNKPFNKLYDNIYGGAENRVWSLDTAYIDQTAYKTKTTKTYKIIPNGNVCYYKVNPFDLEKMEFSTQQVLEYFEWNYMNIDNRVKKFLLREVVFKNIAIEYQVNKMGKELEELSAFFTDKNIVINILISINNKYIMNEDIIRVIISKYLY
jgi:hypothetical protein